MPYAAHSTLLMHTQKQFLLLLLADPGFMLNQSSLQSGGQDDDQSGLRRSTTGGMQRWMGTYWGKYLLDGTPEALRSYVNT